MENCLPGLKASVQSGQGVWMRPAEVTRVPSPSAKLAPGSLIYGYALEISDFEEILAESNLSPEQILRV